MEVNFFILQRPEKRTLRVFLYYKGILSNLPLCYINIGKIYKIIRRCINCGDLIKTEGKMNDQELSR